MTSSPQIVFVLGAGFTRAFLPGAPLLVDEYYGDELESKFRDLPHASRILELERSRNPEGKIDIERLMTRLEGRMPYDSSREADEQLALLMTELKHCFMRRLDDAKEKGEFHKAELDAIAAYCIRNKIDCITFNYDDVFDRALWGVAGIIGHTPYPHWGPDGGYGFPCRPSDMCIYERPLIMVPPTILLLKLHGSANWRIRLGAPQPYQIDSVVHHENWYPNTRGFKSMTFESVDDLLEPEPFMVPPILIKTALVEQPILRLVWSKAYNILANAEEIIFVGYSLPITDLAASFLFGEAIKNEAVSNIRVVNHSQDEEAQENVIKAYRTVFPNLSEKQFDFRHALDWSREIERSNDSEETSL